MTGTCGEPLIFCDKPEGHSGGIHHAEWPMPPEAARLIAATLNETEKRGRSYRRWKWFFIVTTGVNIGLIYALIGAP